MKTNSIIQIANAFKRTVNNRTSLVYTNIRIVVTKNDFAADRVALTFYSLLNCFVHKCSLWWSSPFSKKLLVKVREKFFVFCKMARGAACQSKERSFVICQLQIQIAPFHLCWLKDARCTWNICCPFTELTYRKQPFDVTLDNYRSAGDKIQRIVKQLASGVGFWQ